MSQSVGERAAIPANDGGRSKIVMALPVALVWVMFSALAAAYFTWVMVPRLPSAVHIFVMYLPNWNPAATTEISLLVITVWSVTVCSALLAGIGFLFKRRRDPNADGLGVLLIIVLALNISAPIASCYFQLDAAEPTQPLPFAVNNLILLANAVLEAIGIATFIVASLWRTSRAARSAANG